VLLKPGYFAKHFFAPEVSAQLYFFFFFFSAHAYTVFPLTVSKCATWTFLQSLFLGIPGISRIATVLLSSSKLFVPHYFVSTARPPPSISSHLIPATYSLIFLLFQIVSRHRLIVQYKSRLNTLQPVTKHHINIVPLPTTTDGFTTFTNTFYPNYRSWWPLDHVLPICWTFAP